jgi:uncharacterized protein (DUF952 family)
VKQAYSHSCAVHTGKYLVLRLDPDKLRGEVKYEPAAPVGDKDPTVFGDGKDPQVFPHLFGTIDVEAVVAEHHVTRDASGTFIAIDGI